MSFRLSSLPLGGALLFVAMVAGAQAARTPGRHPAVCADGVRVYHAKADVPVPYDSVSLPPSPPVRVTSPEEAEAAEYALRKRAGTAGANGVLIMDESTESTDGLRINRSVTAVFAPADSARAAAACKKK